MKDQISKIMEAEGMTPAKFADEIGVQRSSISHVLSGRNKPSFDFISKVLKRFSGINAEWLITGKGSMIKSQNSIDSKDLKQPSLFEKDEREKLKYKSDIQNEKFHIIEGENLLNITETEGKEKNEKRVGKAKFTNVNNMKSILILYSDGSFEQFTPKE